MSLVSSIAVSSIGWTLVHFIWQGALLGLATAVALTFMRGARPEHRYNVACAALLACLAWPALELYLRFSAAHASAVAEQMAGKMVMTAARAGSFELASYLASHLAWIVAFWALCTAALTLRMVLGLWWVGRMGSSRARDPHWQARVSALARAFDVSREVRLRVVENLASPVTAGWLRPVVLVPAALISGMPPELLEALLAHEMAHIRRFDYLVNLGQNVVETLLFYHPAVWWISRQVRIEREQIADDFAARKLGEPRRLALALSELERFQFATHHLAQAANGGDLMSRIKRLIRPETPALNWKAAIPVLGLAAACFGLYANAAAPEQHAASASAKTPAIVDFTTCTKPMYPPLSIQKGETGVVTIGLQIDDDGTVVNSKVAKSSGFRELDRAANQALAKCHFTAATKDGKPVKSWMKMQYVWSLK